MDDKKELKLVEKIIKEIYKNNNFIKDGDISYNKETNKVDVKGNIFGGENELKLPKNVHYEYDRGFVFSNANEIKEIKIEFHHLDNMYNPSDVIYTLQADNPDKKFKFNSNTNSIELDEDLNNYNLDTLKSHGFVVDDGKLINKDMLVNGNPVCVGMVKTHTLEDTVSNAIDKLQDIALSKSTTTAPEQDNTKMNNLDMDKNKEKDEQAELEEILNNDGKENANLQEISMEELKIVYQKYGLKCMDGNFVDISNVVAYDKETQELNSNVTNKRIIADGWFRSCLQLYEVDINNIEDKNFYIDKIFNENYKEIFSIITDCLKNRVDLNSIISRLNNIQDDKLKQVAKNFLTDNIDEKTLLVLDALSMQVTGQRLDRSMINDNEDYMTMVKEKIK